VLATLVLYLIGAGIVEDLLVVLWKQTSSYLCFYKVICC